MHEDDPPLASDEQHRRGREILLAAYDRLVVSGEMDDLPLASDEAHAALYALLAEAYGARDPDGARGGADEDPAPPALNS